MDDFSLRDGLIELFSDDPLTWGKWLLVLTAFVLTFVVRFRYHIDDKFDPYRKLDEKVKKAIEEKHVITASIVKGCPDPGADRSTGIYEYKIDGVKRRYRADFNTGYPPRFLHLFYEDTPDRLFTNEEYHRSVIRSLPLVFINLLPFLVGALMVWILGLAK